MIQRTILVLLTSGSLLLGCNPGTTSGTGVDEGNPWGPVGGAAPAGGIIGPGGSDAADEGEAVIDAGGVGSGFNPAGNPAEAGGSVGFGGPVAPASPTPSDGGVSVLSPIFGGGASGPSDPGLGPGLAPPDEGPSSGSMGGGAESGDDDAGETPPVADAGGGGTVDISPTFGVCGGTPYFSETTRARWSGPEAGGERSVTVSGTIFNHYVLDGAIHYEATYPVNEAEVAIQRRVRRGGNPFFPIYEMVSLETGATNQSGSFCKSVTVDDDINTLWVIAWWGGDDCHRLETPLRIDDPQDGEILCLETPSPPAMELHMIYQEEEEEPDPPPAKAHPRYRINQKSIRTKSLH